MALNIDILVTSVSVLKASRETEDLEHVRDLKRFSFQKENSDHVENRLLRITKQGDKLISFCNNPNKKL